MFSSTKSIKDENEISLDTYCIVKLPRIGYTISPKMA